MDETLADPSDSSPPDPIPEQPPAEPRPVDPEPDQNELQQDPVTEVTAAMDPEPDQNELQQDPATEATAAATTTATEEETTPEPAKSSASVGGSGVGKRKRGRPPKAQAAAKAVLKRKEKEEEEVCFVCFDGGSLVCCDRRGCPKVYHAACINRDEDFFKRRGKWNCGWHICSLCEKAAQNMCYTCTYSLCKGCSKENKFIRIRGNKGFCESCYSNVMHIESKGHTSEEKVGTDEKNSFESLFEYYWFDIKRKLSFTTEELQNASKSLKGPGSSVRKGDSSDELYDGNDEEEVSSESSSRHHGAGTSARKRERRRSRVTNALESYAKQQVDNLGASVSEDAEWASKELLELVAHMKGDKSVLSQFDVQELLLDYIKQNNLRDPRRKSQIICDARLENLFGKPRVGHFEMLKLLESHFLVKETSLVVPDDNQEVGLDPDFGQMEAEEHVDGATKIILDKRRKSRKKVEDREIQTNINDYAAIDAHNIGLIFLRRSLVEDLLDDVNMFTEKVIGSFVRIRISTVGQKQDMYRLVQVVGTSKAAENYKTGRKSTDFILEILNLNKKETITIDTVSNQDFTEEECKRLRQSIKCGLISRLTVGDIQEKARVLQAVRVNDWLESEKQRLGHLRDRASDMGRRKELRECVEKLQLLNSPEERIRRLNEIPEIHSDPKMDPGNESADEEEYEDKNQDDFSKPRDSSTKNGKDSLPLGRGGPASSNWFGGRKGSSFVRDSSRGTRAEGAQEKPETTTASPRQHLMQSHGVTPETATASPTPVAIDETEKIWNYRDPAGKIQGPFSMIELRKWSKTGYFPVDMRIWRASESEEEDCVLLNDALVGKFEKDLPQWEPPLSNFSQPQPFCDGSDSQADNQGRGWRQSRHPTSVGNDPSSGVWAGNNVNTERPSTDRWVSQLSTGLAPRLELRSSTPRGLELAGEINAWPGQPHVHSSPRSIAPLSGNQQGPPLFPGSGVQVVGNAGGWNQNNWSSNNPQMPQPAGQGFSQNLSHPQMPQLAAGQGYAQTLNNPPGPQHAGQGFGQQHTNWVSSSQQSSRNQWRNGPYTLPAPIQQPSWAPTQGTLNTPPSPTPGAQSMSPGWGSMRAAAPVTPFLPLGTGWGPALGTGINGGRQTAELYRAVPAANLVSGTSGWDANPPTGNMLNQITGNNASHIQQSLQPDALDVRGNHSVAFPRTEMISPSNPVVLGCSTASDQSHVVKKNHFFESGCPSPTPSNERQELPAVQIHELSTGKLPSEVNERLESDPASVSRALETLDPLTSSDSKALNLISGNFVEVSDQQDNMSPIRGSEAKPIPSARKLSDGSEEISPPLAQRSEQLHSLHKPEHVEISNFEGLQDKLMGDMWSLPSPTPATNTHVRNVGTVSPPGNGQNNPWISSDGSKLLPLSGLSTEQLWEANNNDKPSTGWGVPLQEADNNQDPNIVWGDAAGGNEYMTRRAPALGNANPSQGWGTRQQVNVNADNSNAYRGSGMANQSSGQGSGHGDANGWDTRYDQRNDSDSRYAINRGGDARNSGDSRHDSIYGGVSRHESRYGGGRSQWNERMDRGGRSSRTSPRREWQGQGQGQGQGICKFHESGYCKKGASCNYLHL